MFGARDRGDSRLPRRNREDVDAPGHRAFCASPASSIKRCSMPDITSLLERAAAEPIGAPDVEGPYRRARRHRVIAIVAAAVVVIGTPAFVVLTARSTRPHVVVTTPLAPGQVAGQGVSRPDQRVFGCSCRRLVSRQRSPHAVVDFTARDLVRRYRAARRRRPQTDPVPAQCDNQLPVAGVRDGRRLRRVRMDHRRHRDRKRRGRPTPPICHGARTASPLPAGHASTASANFDVDGHGVGVTS